MGNVVLIGFMGCGKSSVAVKLSYRMKRQMTDTDKWIEKKEGKTVKDGDGVLKAVEGNRKESDHFGRRGHACA